MNQTLDRFILPGLKYLPAKMDSPQARAMLLSIGMQESRFEHRKQIGGPARGFWQFEQGGGVTGVLKHSATQEIITEVCGELRITPTPAECYEAIAYNDILACCFARLLLWTLAGALPSRGESAKAWNQYVSAWRPGKPHRDTWDSFFDVAWLSIYEKEGV